MEKRTDKKTLWTLFKSMFLFIGSLFILRKWKVSAVSVILGSGVVGTVAYCVLGFSAAM